MCNANYNGEIYGKMTKISENLYSTYTVSLTKPLPCGEVFRAYATDGEKKLLIGVIIDGKAKKSFPLKELKNYSFDFCVIEGQSKTQNSVLFEVNKAFSYAKYLDKIKVKTIGDKDYLIL